MSAVRVCHPAPAYALWASARRARIHQFGGPKGVGCHAGVALATKAGLAPSMKYVYILESEIGEHFYVGITDDLRARLAAHNEGHVSHTSKHLPWRIKTYVALSDEKTAFAFEKYLKSASGRAFSKKRF
jgi:putative endonuclease